MESRSRFLNSLIYLALVAVINLACQEEEPLKSYESELLSINPISQNIYVHVSQLDIPNYGKFPCNGMIAHFGNEAVIYDTPVDSASAVQLKKWIEEELGAEIKAVVVNHFHVDCLGSLNVFHEAGIDSYASNKTILLAKQDSVPVLPKKGFDIELELKIADHKLQTTFFGEGHTIDNVVSYIPSEEALFGGCLIKSVNAKKGNLADANVAEWSNTVQAIKKAYPNLKYVVPGHGKTGGTALLDYTIELFAEGDQKRDIRKEIRASRGNEGE